jgi:hypothetical protein
MRDTRFTGCSGYITFEKGTNNRDLGTFDIQNGRMNGEKHEVKVAGYYNPIAATVWTFFEGGIVWPDGTTNVPSDSRTVEHDCPFPDDDI